MHSPRKYSFQLLNARSVRNKVDLITQLIIDSNCSISAITETWLTNDDSALASQMTPDGFKLLLANMSTSHRGGGLALLFSSELKLISSSTPCFSSCEILICNIQFPSLFTIVIVLIIYIYRQPSSSLRSFLTDLSSILESITSVNTVILGDFNIQINNDNYASLSMNELIFEYSLTQQISFPTNTNGNTIDLVLSLADSNLISYPTQSYLISDHFAILFDLNLPVSQINRPSRSFRKISSIDKPIFVNSVFHQLNNSISYDLSTLFDSFNLALSHSPDIFAPSITLINRTYSKSPWFNTELIKLRQLLRRLQRKYASSRLDSDIIAFKSCRSLYKNKLLSTKSSYFTDMLSSYGISSKQAYTLSFTLVGKTQTKHLPDKPDSVICSLFVNFF